MVALPGAAPLAFGLDRRGRRGRALGLFASFNLGRVPRDVAHQAIFLRGFDQRGVQTLRQLRGGKAGKGARGGSLMQSRPTPPRQGPTIASI